MVKEAKTSRRITEPREGAIVRLEGVLERSHGKSGRVSLSCERGTFEVIPGTDEVREELIKVGWPNNRYAATIIGELVRARGGESITAHSIQLQGQASNWTPPSS